MSWERKGEGVYEKTVGMDVDGMRNEGNMYEKVVFRRRTLP